MNGEYDPRDIAEDGITSGLMSLETKMGELRGLVDELLADLQPVLREVEVNSQIVATAITTDKITLRVEPRSPLAMRIDAIAGSVQAEINRLYSMRGRVNL